MSDESKQLRIKDLVFFKRATSVTGSSTSMSIAPIPGYKIANERFDNMHGAQSLNLIIGANKSGKSRFIRSLLKLEFRLITNETWKELKELYEELARLVAPFGLGSLESYINITNLDAELLVNTSDIQNVINRYNKSNPDVTKEIYEIVERMKSVKYLKLDSSIYIPALRTPHTLFDSEKKPLKENYYFHTLSENYPEIKNVESSYNVEKTNIDVFTGINLYEEIIGAKNSKTDKRERFKEFESFLSANFFDGDEVVIVSLVENETRRIIVHIKGREKDKDIHLLGDGIQAIIVLMYKIFMAEENTLIVIDEPEQHLHPGLQRIFMKSTIDLLIK